MTAASPICTMHIARRQPCAIRRSAGKAFGTCSTVRTRPTMTCANGIIAVLMIRSPLPPRRRAGPPELPGLSAASVWITSPISCPF